MFQLRQAAVRLLTTKSTSIVARPRTITTFTSLPSKPARFAAPLQYQRRWASGEAEARKEQETPVSHLQPTPQEEVENVIHEDNATSSEARGLSNAQANKSTATTDTTDDATTTAAEPGYIRQAVESLASSSIEQAKAATKNLTQGITGESAPRERRQFREPPTPKRTIYVGNLFFDVTENDLTKEFSRFGEISKTRLIRDSRGLSKGFGYLQYETTEQAQKAVDELNQQLFEGRRLMVSFANTEEDDVPKRQRAGEDYKPVNAPSKTLFIGNMSFEMTDRDLNNLFRGIRNVIDVRVAIDRRTGQPRGFAHADFVDVKSAMEALKVLSGKENYGRKLRCDYSYGPSTAPRNTPR